MTDVELLKLAGKAIGKFADKGWLEFVDNEYRDGQGPLTGWYDDETETVWNSLANKADAFELAIDLGLDVFVHKENNEVVACTDPSVSNIDYDVSEPYKDKPYYAACIAITRVAAEIAKNMP